MTSLFGAAFEVQAFLASHQWKFCMIGGIAVLRWGEPRFTRDVDISLFTGFGTEPDFIAPILASQYKSRIASPLEFAIRNRVLLLESPDEVPIDIALAGLPYERGIVERSSFFEFEP